LSFQPNPEQGVGFQSRYDLRTGQPSIIEEPMPRLCAIIFFQNVLFKNVLNPERVVTPMGFFIAYRASYKDWVF
jgi:hypothetical protein